MLIFKNEKIIKIQNYSVCICNKIILETLPDCSHKALITCGSDPRKVLCQEDLQLTFNECQHIYNYKCSQRQNVLTTCQQNCEKMLQCGHNCKKKCSQICYIRQEICNIYQKKSKIRHLKQYFIKYIVSQVRNLNKKIKSKSLLLQPCEDKCIKIKTCGHKCQNLCYELCSPCNQQISIKLHCGEHYIQKKCFEIQNHLILNLKITPYFIRSQIGQKYLNNMFQQLADGSGDVLKYFIQKQEFNCRSPCQKPRQCGHIYQCTNLCYQECTPCEYVISLQLECGHRYSILCKNQCSYVHAPCEQKISVSLRCGHQYEIQCKNKNDFLQNFQCNKKCMGQYSCGHQQQCKQLCFEQCTPCQEIVLKQLNCGHSVRTQCFNNYICKKVCSRIRQCGHRDRCRNKCGQECSPCQEIITIKFFCGHQITTKCSSTQCERSIEHQSQTIETIQYSNYYCKNCQFYQ